MILILQLLIIGNLLNFIFKVLRPTIAKLKLLQIDDGGVNNIARDNFDTKHWCIQRK